MENKLEILRKEAETNKVPIIRSKTQDLLVEILAKKDFSNLLELGMAIGYSSLVFATNFDCKITTIELDDKNVLPAIKNFKDFGCLERITIINGDAKEVKIDEKFDVIFIDAGKSWYSEYFNMYKKNLNPNGLIIFDNVNYHGLLQTNMRKHRTIVRRMNDFHEMIKTQDEFLYKFYDVDDGILILSQDEKYFS